ncbi:hypothetical protein MNBD_PLANCTO02-1979 [hydrothermal vent metagenome]|uniref:Uncharacterized protein n=1 Tax=hydrothermal vent metagenome TaxID=652676 RepID=A0A3B1DNM1_9ZZZZ
MNLLIQKYQGNTMGTLKGWDRIVFQGTLRALCFAEGMPGHVPPS